MIKHCFESLESRVLLTSAQLVAEIDTTTPGSSAGQFIEFQGVAYFGASTPQFGYELWRSDGTAGGTWQVKDITAGAGSTNMRAFCAVGNTLYFLRDAGLTSELWKTDGTESGTSVAVAGLEAWETGELLEHNGILYFPARDISAASTRRELFRSDGTRAGTYVVKDINPTGDSSPHDFLVFRNELYFTAYDGINGKQIWKTDGTAAGTVMVTNVNSGGWGLMPYNLTVFNNAIYFAASDDNATNYEIWKTDGTAAGTQVAVETYSGYGGSKAGELTVSGSKLFFVAQHEAAGRELWVTDGTQAGSHLVKDIRVGYYDLSVYYFADNNGILFFNVENAYAESGIWRSDGTEAGTYRVSGALPSTLHNVTSPLVVVGSKVYFTMVDDAPVPSRRQLCVVEDDPASARQLTDSQSSSSYPQVLTRIGDMLFFKQYTPQHGSEPWKTDGTPVGTVMIRDINTARTPASSPEQLTRSGQYVYFTANVAAFTGRELWRTDGTAAGTILLKDITPGTNSTTLSWLTDVGGILYFVVGSGTAARLWRSDGTANGTAPLGNSLNFVSNLLNVDGVLHFLARDTAGYGVYKLADAGPVLLSNLGTAVPNVSSQLELTRMFRHDGALYFRAGASGDVELWRYDLAGTSPAAMVRNINPTTASYPQKFTVVGDSIFFMANNGTNGFELWKTDGTEAGTVLVKDIYDGFADSTPSYLINFDGVLLFQAATAAAGSELWRSDGTAAGTYMIRDIRPGASSSIPRNLTAMDGFVLLEAAEDNRNELWRTDGTADGTYMVKRIGSATSGSDPQQFIRVGDRLFFQARDPQLGTELFTSDGTAAGTRMVTDIEPGSASSTPRTFVQLDGTIYFIANSTIIGREVWRYGGPQVPQLALQPDGTLLIEGTNDDEIFSVTSDVADRGNSIIITRGTQSWSFPKSSVNAILFETYGGDDALDYFAYEPLPHVTLHGGSGHSDLNIEEGDYVFLEDAAIGNESLHVHVGWRTSVRFETTQHLASLFTFESDATLTAGGSKTLFTRGVTPDGYIDLGTGNLVWDYGAADDSPLQLALTYTASGRVGGEGFRASGVGTGGLYGLGVAEASDVFGISGAQTALFAGEAVDATAVLIKFTFAGDANLDGRIDADDYFQIDAGYARQRSGYFHGDFDYSGVIDGDDYFIIDGNYAAAQTAALRGAAGAEIPSAFFSLPYRPDGKTGDEDGDFMT